MTGRPSGMAMSDHLLDFRSMSTVELTDLRTSLRAQRSVFSAQSMGTKSFQRDLRLLTDQLAAIAYVLKERSLPAGENNFIGVTNFGLIK